MNTDSHIHAVVMRRVRTAHTLRALSGGIGASFLLLVVSLYFIGREVWVARVFENMPHTFNAVAVAQFFFGAFAGTEVAVQSLTLLSLIALGWLVRSLSRVVISHPSQFA